MIEGHITPWRKADLRIAEPEIVAVGDAHGEAELLERLLAEIDAAASPAAPLVFLGDLVDRGARSRDCLALAAACAERRPTLWLMGNHEAMLLAFLGAHNGVTPERLRRWGETWLFNGGDAVLAEYGLDEGATGAELRGRMGSQERIVLDNLRMSFRSGDTVFVHGGLSRDCLVPENSGYALDEAEYARFVALHPLDVDHEERHPLWIRDEFLRFFARIASGPVVVHGHTPAPKDAQITGFDHAGAGDLRLRGRRLNLDAGSGKTGEVAAAIIRNGRYRIVHARRNGVS